MYEKDYTKIKNKKKHADVGLHKFTKSVFYTPPLTEKKAGEIQVSIVLMLISLN